MEVVTIRNKNHYHETNEILRFLSSKSSPKYKPIADGLLEFKKNYIGQLYAVHKLIVNLPSKKITYLGVDYKNEKLEDRKIEPDRIVYNDRYDGVIMYIISQHGGNLLFRDVFNFLKVRLLEEDEEDNALPYSREEKLQDECLLGLCKFLTFIEMKQDLSQFAPGITKYICDV